MPEEEEEFREFRPFCILLASNPSPQVESWTTLEIVANAASSAWKVYIFYLKALAGLKKLTDKSPEKRLEPLQEHLTFPALIYLRWIFCICNSAFSVMMLVFEWSCRQEAKPGWKLHHLCAGLCLLSIFKNTLDGLLSGERPAEVFSPRFQSIFPSLFSSSCLLLVGRKDVLASEGLILAVIKTSQSLLLVWDYFKEMTNR